MKDNELSKRWCDALVLAGESGLIESSVRELTEYFGINCADALKSCLAAQREAKREWEAEPRDTVHDVEAFYRTTRSYLFEQVWRQATEPDTQAANVALLDFARTLGAREYLDFGSGVGASAMLFAQHGFQVTLADISPTMLAFARWRMQRRGLHANFIDLNQQPLPRHQFAFVTAVDVLEYLYDPAVELQQIGDALVVGGTFAFNFRAGVDPQRPMQLAQSSAPIFHALRKAGLRGTPSQDAGLAELQAREFACVRRIAQSRVLDWGYKAFDFVYHNDRRQGRMQRAS